MSTRTRVSSSTTVALVTPPSDVDYGASVTSILQDRHPGLTTTRLDPTIDAALPTPDDADLVIVTGSTARVHDTDPWIDRLAATLRRLVESRTPVLGVCFGHQLLATSLGGRIDTLDTRAAGYREIASTPEGRNHLLFDGLSRRFTAFLWHRDHVTDPPPDATILARNETGIQAFACRNRPAFGIQFHPEVAIADARTLTASRPTSVLAPAVDAALTEEAASRAARARRIYENALRATNRQNSAI